MRRVPKWQSRLMGIKAIEEDDHFALRRLIEEGSFLVNEIHENTTPLGRVLSCKSVNCMRVLLERNELNLEKICLTDTEDYCEDPGVFMRATFSPLRLAIELCLVWAVDDLLVHLASIFPRASMWYRGSDAVSFDSFLEMQRSKGALAIECVTLVEKYRRRYLKAQRVTLSLFPANQENQSLAALLPRDVVRMIAREVWKSRREAVWE